MTILKELEQMKGWLTELSNQRQKELGKLEQLNLQLKGMGISSYEEGRKIEAERIAERKQAEEQAAQILEDIREEFKDYL